MKRLLTNTIQLNWLRTFEVASRHLSFTSAAEELSMSQSAISQQIQLLEHHLDQKLFVRANRAIRLTDAGQAFVPLVCESLHQLNVGAAQIFAASNDAVVNVNINATFAVLWLAPHLLHFSQIHPQITIRQRSTNWSTDFDISTADLEIRYGSGSWPGFESFSLLKPKLRPYCTAANAQRIRQPSDLITLPLVDVIGTPQGWTQWLEHMNLSDLDMQVRQYTDSHAAAVSMCADGVGVCLMYDEMMQQGILASQLVAPFAESIDTEGGYYLCHHVDKELSVASHLFKDWLLSNTLRSSIQ